jgi:hypothetical protein
MSKILSLTLSALVFSFACSAQVVLNEIYTSPGGSKHEFFELYNSGTESTPLSVDGFSIVTYFEQGTSKGFYVLDLPSLFISPRGYFVGSSSIPFNYQGTTNSPNSNFSWNSASLSTSSGYMKKWVMTGTSSADGNVSYDEASVPANFNDFFYDKSGGGANYAIFVFKNGIPINSFYGGASGTTQPAFITSMPSLNVNSVIAGASTPFTINFSSFTANQAEYVTPSAGTDNGYTRLQDGVCNTWDKSSSTVNHTPGVTNGAAGSTSGNVTITGAITRPFAPATTSAVKFDITAASSTVFPVELQVYTDNGTVPGELDALDVYVTSVTQTSLADGYITVSFTPSGANILVVAKTAAGCFGQVKLLVEGSNSTLPVKLTSFNGNIRNNAMQLNWVVDMNETAEGFVIERSLDGGKFSAIGSVQAKTNSGRQQYSYNDPLTVGKKVSYRLLMTDRDHKSEYSKIILFNLFESLDAAVTLLQNPVQHKVDMNFISSAVENIWVRVIDLRGAMLLTLKTTVQAGTNLLSLQLPATTTSGTYVLSVTHSSGTISQKFIRR